MTFITILYNLLNKEICLSVNRSHYLRVDLAGELQSPQVGSISALILLHRVIDDTQATRLRSIHHPGSKDELLSHGNANCPGETLCTTCTEVRSYEKPGWDMASTTSGHNLKIFTGNYEKQKKRIQPYLLQE